MSDDKLSQVTDVRAQLATWAYLGASQLWAAALWVRPGWVPALAMLAFFVLGLLCLYQDHIMRAIDTRVDHDTGET